MAMIDDVVAYLGKPYTIATIDHEPVIHRTLKNFELEVSGLHKHAMNCVVYVWLTNPLKELIGIYENIRSKEDLKDILGYCSVKYQNLLSQIRVAREGQTK